MTATAGPPPSLVLVPGLGLRPRAWRPTTTALAPVPTRVVSLPGYGTRPGPGAGLTPEELGRALAAAHLRRGARQVLVGHSASCQVVAHAATAEPSAVSALVLVGPTTDPRARHWPGLLGRWLRTAAHEPPGQVPTLLGSWARTGPTHALRAMERARHDDLLRTLGDVRCPVLVLRGPRDRICPPDWGRRLVARAPAGSRSVTLAAGAHMVPLTHGPLVATVLRGLVDGSG